MPSVNLSKQNLSVLMFYNTQFVDKVLSGRCSKLLLVAVRNQTEAEENTELPTESSLLNNLYFLELLFIVVET